MLSSTCPLIALSRTFGCRRRLIELRASMAPQPSHDAQGSRVGSTIDPHPHPLKEAVEERATRWVCRDEELSIPRVHELCSPSMPAEFVRSVTRDGSRIVFRDRVTDQALREFLYAVDDAINRRGHDDLTLDFLGSIRA